MNRVFTSLFRFSAALALASATLTLAQVPHSKHVYVVAEENRSYERIVGSSDMPYLNSLLAKGALATQFYSNQHSSLPNYFWLTAGQPLTANNSTTAVFDVDNIERHLLRLGLTFKSYAQSLPYPGYTGLYYNNYYRRHAPLPYFAEMANSSLVKNHVSSDQLATDIANNDLPNFAFITPDVAHDMHNCPTTLSACEQEADIWLRDNIGPLLKTAPFQAGGDGLLILWADEADLGTDNRCSATVLTGCGGRIVVAMIGPQVRGGYRSFTLYHHESLLRTILEALGVSGAMPGAASSAYDMNEMFFSATNGINLLAPVTGTTVASPLHVVANAFASKPITAMQVYVDNQLVESVSGTALDTSIPEPQGSHFVVVQAWDSAGHYYKKAATVNVVPGVEFTIGTPEYWVQNPIPFSASATSSLKPITALQVYVDNQLLYTAKGSSLRTSLSLASGTHQVTYQAWDTAGRYYKQGQIIITR
jgi:acid phosphatase